MNPAAKIVEEYLRLLMIPDPEAARRYCAPEMEIRFTGNRPMRDPSECAAFNRGRYKWVKKAFGPTHVAEGGTDDETVVYQTGTLYGEQPTRIVEWRPLIGINRNVLAIASQVTMGLCENESRSTKPQPHFQSGRGAERQMQIADCQ